MKFKIGDRVRIKGNASYLKKGTTGTIVNIDGSFALLKCDKDTNLYSIYGKNHWLTRFEYLELIKENKKPTNKFFFKGDKTIYYNKDGKRYCVKCCEDDVYDKKVGMLYVLAKAQGIDLREIDELIEEPKKEQKKDKKTKWKVGDKFVIIDNSIFVNDIHKGDKGEIIEDLGSGFVLKIKNIYFEQFVSKTHINEYLRRI